MRKSTKHVNPWAWVPSLYFNQGLPYAVVILVSVILYKDLGMSNTDIAFYTSWFYVPWVVKPFWGPIVDNISTKRFWIVVTQILMGAGFAVLGLSLQLPEYIKWSLIVFWLLAFSSATHDIAADGFYMLGLTQKEQSFFVGIRNTAYRIAMIAAQGGIVIFAGILGNRTSNPKMAWTLIFVGTGVVYFGIAIYHWLIFPKPDLDDKRKIFSLINLFESYFKTWTAFFQKPQILIGLFFILLYRLGEAQLGKIAAPFLMDDPAVGGLGYNKEQVGFLYGTVGVLALVGGGLLGGILASKKGLKYWMWPMVMAMNLPNLAYVYLAYFPPSDISITGILIAIEQFGYGLGFTAFTLYLIHFCEGELRTSHYAFATGFMALGMMLPGMISGWIQEQIGYQYFFIWVLLCTIPGFLLVRFLHIDPRFGMKVE
ncbi:MFS transporter [Saccharicrinis sp. FJH2]|uniref:MFS transporter n=1 Tax=Saccharicrinis sp. FJH65 TaxID=3344659 RepID=UPI0035F4E072